MMHSVFKELLNRRSSPDQNTSASSEITSTVQTPSVRGLGWKGKGLFRSADNAADWRNLKKKRKKGKPPITTVGNTRKFKWNITVNVQFSMIMTFECNVNSVLWLCVCVETVIVCLWNENIMQKDHKGLFVTISWILNYNVKKLLNLKLHIYSILKLISK